MSARERETVNFLQSSFQIFEECSARHGGELIKTTGDGALLLFDAPTQAIEYTADVRQALAGLRVGMNELLGFRAGIHVGEVLLRDGDVYGHAVNIAARLQTVADAGETCISAEVFALVRHNSRFAFEAIGGRRLKNIPNQMQAYLVRDPSAHAPRTNAARLEISTIGGLRLQSPSTGQTSPARDAKLVPIGYLALNAEADETIGRLCALFWPDRAPSQARRALNRLLRKVVETYGDVCHRDSVSAGLSPDAISVDLITLEQDLRAGRIDPMLLHTSDWPDRILAGTKSIGTLYAAWLVVTRSDWRTRIAQALELCLDRFQVQDDGLRDAAIALLRIEPGHEHAARLLIRHYHAVDNPGAAFRVYTELERELDQRFGLAPKPETRAAARGANDNSPERHRTWHALPLRIQVMTLTSADPAKRDLLASFRSEILASLACFRGWVIAEGEQPEAGMTVRSDYRLDGSDVGGQAGPQVILRLSEVPSGRVVWSDTFAIGTGQFRTSERSAVARIAAALEIYLSTDRLGTARPDPAHSIVDEWLRAERIFFRWTAEAHDEAERIYRDLVARAPDYAPALASLAGRQNVRHIVRPGEARDLEEARKAYDLAERAAELDPLDARNQLAVAWSAALAGDFDKASMHMEMAARLNPNSPRTLVSCAMGFAFFGEHDRARATLEHSLNCAPVLLGYQWCYAASVYYLAGDLEKALQASERGRDSIIDNAGWYAAILARLGRPDASAAAFARLQKTVRPAWSGEGPATPEAVYAWFTSAYPIRRDQERQMLAFLK